MEHALFKTAHPADGKIDLLFRDRHVEQLAKGLLAPDAYEDWAATARAIQRAIYDIDQFYEASVRVESDSESPYWCRIREAISASSVENSSDLVWKHFSDLEQYAHVERRTHELDLLCESEFERITLLKCADVAIARGLIWGYLQNPPSAVTEYWSLFDRCGELIEDIQDLNEDLFDWNFNFWLYSRKAGLSAHKSIGASRRALLLLLTELEQAFGAVPDAMRDNVKIITDRMLSRGKSVLMHYPTILMNAPICTYEDLAAGVDCQIGVEGQQLCRGW